MLIKSTAIGFRKAWDLVPALPLISAVHHLKFCQHYSALLMRFCYLINKSVNKWIIIKWLVTSNTEYLCENISQKPSGSSHAESK